MSVSSSLPMLWIVADDLGVSRGRNAGIAELASAGAIDAASLLVTCPHAARGVDAVADTDVALGLHLNLTEGRPALVGAEAARLAPVVGAAPHPPQPWLAERAGASAEWWFVGRTKAWEALMAGEDVDVDALVNEIVAQLEAFVSLAGRIPAHIDGHQHVHVIPAVARAIVAALDRLAAAKPELWAGAAIRIRVPTEAAPGELSPFCARVAHLATATLAIWPLAREVELWQADGFAGMAFMGCALTTAKLDSLGARGNPTPGKKLIEIMTHPGWIGCDWDDFDASADREHELEQLRGLLLAP